MDIKKLDSNFIEGSLPNEEIEWIELPSNKVTLKGIYYDKEHSRFARMPLEIASQISDRFAQLSTHTTGGRILFETDSPFIALRGTNAYVGIVANMPLYAIYGFGVHQGGDYIGSIFTEVFSTLDDCYLERGGHPTAEQTIEICGYKPRKFNSNKFTINFPLMTNVRTLYLGVKKGSYVKPCDEFKPIAPIVFYGSSVTHGSCASHPGYDYPSLISKWLNVDYINLGFAGGCKGDEVMVNYLASLDSSAMVIEYDFNSSLEELTERHITVYKNIRKVKPNLPLVFMSRASCDYYAEAEARRKVIEQTIEYAKSLNDKNVYYIDGRKLFGEDADRTLCTADTCHPSDLGFYKMAKVITQLIQDNNII